jgi:RNase P/RNase MRP subunit p29
MRAYNLLINRLVKVQERKSGSVTQSGMFVAETKNMAILLSGSSVKKVPKSVSIFLLEDGTRIDGRTILRRPVERLMLS